MTRIVVALLDELRARDKLVLIDGADSGLLADEIVDGMPAAASWTQAGKFLGDSIASSDLVEELYADDREIVSMLNHLNV